MIDEKKILTFENQRTFFVSVLSIFFGFQVLFIASLISSLVPIVSPIQIISFQYTIFPEREIVLYGIFIVSIILAQMMLMFLLRKKSITTELLERLKEVVVIDGALLVFALYVVFKLFLYHFPRWAEILLLCIVLLRIFFIIFHPSLKEINKILDRWVSTFSKVGDIIVPIAIGTILWVPDAPGMIARIFHYDQFNHWQSFIIAPGFASLKGCILGIDVFSQYGVGMPFLVSRLAQAGGGFGYESVFRVLSCMTIIYYLFVYVLLRAWIKGFFIPALGVLWAIHLQMFCHPPVMNNIWIFPSGTIIRYFFDIFFFIFIWFYLKTSHWKYLIFSAVVVGLSLPYIFDTGVYLFFSFFCCILLLVFIKILRGEPCSWPRCIGSLSFVFLLPLSIAFVCYQMLSKGHALNPLFWKNLGETGQLFLAGFGALPIYCGLQQKEFLYFFFGCLIPVVYLFNLCVMCAGMVRKPANNHNLFLAILSIYGLSLYSYYICRSAPSSYLAVILPLVYILCFWASRIAGLVQLKWRKVLALFVALSSLLIIVTSERFLQYPNLYFMHKEEVLSYVTQMKETLILDEDAALVARFVAPQEEACIISEMAAEILMKANRKPLLYYPNLLSPQSFGKEIFDPLFLFTPQRVSFFFDSLEMKKPPYIFIDEKIVLSSFARFLATQQMEQIGRAHV